MWKFLAGVLVGAVSVELLSDSPVKTIEHGEHQPVEEAPTDADDEVKIS